MNRSITDVYSVEKDQGKILYDYVLGVYDFLEKLTERYPEGAGNSLLSGSARHISYIGPPAP